MRGVEFLASADVGRGLVFDAWWRHNNARCPPEMTMGEWRRRTQKAIERVVDKAQVIVATVDDDPCGAVCYEPGLLHFVYVIFPVRRWGVGRGLLRRAIRGYVGRVRYTTRPHTRFSGIVDPAWKFAPSRGIRL